MAVEVLYNDNAQLHIPNEDIGSTLVGHVIGSFITWPKILVIFNDMLVNIDLICKILF